MEHLQPRSEFGRRLGAAGCALLCLISTTSLVVLWVTGLGYLLLYEAAWVDAAVPIIAVTSGVCALALHDSARTTRRDVPARGRARGKKRGSA
jgi:hypothetical protein